MNKKNYTKDFAILLIIILAGIGIYIYFQGKDIFEKPAIVSINTTPTKVNQSQKVNKINNWNVGALINVFAANPGEKFDNSVYEKQIADLKKLGVNHIRSNFEKNGLTPMKWANDLIVDSKEENNWDLTFIVEHPFEDFFSEADYDSGYEWGKVVGSQYSGKVEYYQLANEVSGTLIKSGNGMSEEDYDQEKYEIMKDYLMGLRDGIHNTDPKAKFIVSAHWVCYAIIDMLIRDGLDFDVIGWNWYSEMGDDLSKKETDEKGVIDIPGHFAKYGKPFWIVELNHSGGDIDGDEKQANFFKNILQNSYNSGDIDGIFIYRLSDTTCTEGDQPTSHLGIVKDKTSQNTKSGCDISTPKSAFYTFQDFIKKVLK